LGQLEELEERRLKLSVRLADVTRQKRAIELARTARQVAEERKVDTHRKCVLAGSVIALLRKNMQLLDYLARALPQVTAARDLPVLLATLEALGAPAADHGAGNRAEGL